MKGVVEPFHGVEIQAMLRGIRHNHVPSSKLEILDILAEPSVGAKVGAERPTVEALRIISMVNALGEESFMLPDLHVLSPGATRELP